MAFNLRGLISLDSSGFAKGINDSIKGNDKLKSSVSGTESKIKGLGSSFKGIGSSASSAIGGVKSLGSALMGLKAVQKVGEGIKAGFTQAFDMQGYRVQLETATKDTKKAGKLMSSAIEYANKTPFETGEVAQAASQMEAYGISSEKWLSSVGDMAGATNKSIMQATEAMADGTMGEFERLKEFGIKKDMIMAESAKKYGDDVVFNAKGQMLDQEKMMTVLQDIMVQKFQGGAEKQSKTVRGMWSTIKGVTKVGMASILGIATEGENAGNIIKGSFLDKVASGVQTMSTKLQEFQESGVFTAIQTKLSEFTGFLGNAFSKISEVVGPVIEKLVNTFGPIFTDIFNVITETVLPALGATFDSVFPKLMDTFSSVGDAISSVWEGVIKPVWDAMAPVLQGVVDQIGPIIESALQVIKGLADFVSNVFKGQWSEAWEGIKSAFSGVFDFMKGVVNGFLDTVLAIPRAIGKAAKSIGGKIFGGGGSGEANANGTSYFKGGSTAINERGGEMQVLPSGTSIIPADRTKEMLQNNSTTNNNKNVTINVDAKGMDVNELVSVLELRLANI